MQSDDPQSWPPALKAPGASTETIPVRVELDFAELDSERTTGVGPRVTFVVGTGGAMACERKP